MKISIITPVLNGKKTIKDTIESVIGQSYADIEYIVVDGGSVDGTFEILDAYTQKISKIISEKDNGIYDAMNKGIRVVTGDVIGILNADDMYASGDVIEKVIRKFEKTSADVVYGDLEYVKRKDISKKTRYWNTGTYSIKKLRSGWTIPHPVLFLKKGVYDRIGLYREDFKIAADYEFILRLLKNDIFKLEYINEIFVWMREGGVSGGSLKKRIAGWTELKKAWAVNKLRVPPFFILRRVLLKFGQYFGK